MVSYRVPIVGFQCPVNDSFSVCIWAVILRLSERERGGGRGKERGRGDGVGEGKESGRRRMNEK